MKKIFTTKRLVYFMQSVAPGDIEPSQEEKPKPGTEKPPADPLQAAKDSGDQLTGKLDLSRGAEKLSSASEEEKKGEKLLQEFQTLYLDTIQPALMALNNKIAKDPDQGRQLLLNASKSLNLEPRQQITHPDINRNIDWGTELTYITYDMWYKLKVPKDAGAYNTTEEPSKFESAYKEFIESNSQDYHQIVTAYPAYISQCKVLLAQIEKIQNADA